MKFQKMLCVATLIMTPTLSFADKVGEVRQIVSQKLTDNYAARAIGSNCSSIRTVESKIGKAAMSLIKT